MGEYTFVGKGLVDMSTPPPLRVFLTPSLTLKNVILNHKDSSMLMEHSFFMSSQCFTYFPFISELKYFQNVNSVTTLFQNVSPNIAS